jgi:hypothetical protein
MKTKQTAIDFLIDKHFGGIENVTPDFKKHIEQAKEIEKTQLISCYVIADCRCNKEYAMKDAEHYYNEKYGNEQQ